MLYFQRGAPDESMDDDALRAGLHEALDAITRGGRGKKVLALPPDITRLHSRAGQLTVYAGEYLGDSLTDIMPALGTHYPMSDEELDHMFPGLDHGLFRPHRWRSDLATLGRVPAEYLSQVSDGAVEYDWPAQVNRLLVEGGHDLILSIGQVVPHEVIGFANHNKNVFVGTGGAEGIHKSHFLGAAYGMERIMGRPLTPVRQVLNYASDHFGSDLPLVYVLTVVSPDEAGKLHVRGLFIGDGYKCYELAAALSRQVNFTLMDKPIRRAVVYLDPREFRSTWLGNKAIYRTRMAMADGGELHIIAPGIREFGEDREIDGLIRRFGYRGTPATLDAVAANPELSANLSAAAHLIHGSSEGRFSISYAPGSLSREETEGAGYRWGDPARTAMRFDLEGLESPRVPAEIPATGWRKDRDGEEYFFIDNPALGLWAHESRLID
jgi:nickel-dependent lactate racemase